jgi:hypothetical protein
MKSITSVIILALTTAACSGQSYSEWDEAPNPDPPTPGAPGAPGPNGVSCQYLHGVATLSDYTAYDNFPEAAFSFEFASQDAARTNNEFELLYDVNLFMVNLVSDDLSSIVDLGPIALDEVPARIDVDDYPTGNWGEHDALQANFGHTYYVRSVDGAGRGVAAFKVIGLEPGVQVNIEWVRSLDVDEMLLPDGCGL